jgi:hypothetical protein
MPSDTTNNVFLFDTLRSVERRRTGLESEGLRGLEQEEGGGMPDAVSCEVMRREGLTVAFALVQQLPFRTWWPSLPHRLPKHTFGNGSDPIY